MSQGLKENERKMEKQTEAEGGRLEATPRTRGATEKEATGGAETVGEVETRVRGDG